MYQTLKKQQLRTIFALITSLLIFFSASSTLAMTDMAGHSKHINQMVGKGKWTVVKVWKSNCPACRRSIHHITQFQQRFPEASVVGISLDGPGGKQNAQDFIDQYHLTFPQLLSDDREIDDYLYEQADETLVGTPTIIVYNPQGEIIAVQPGAVTSDDLIGFIRSQQTAAQ